jgi:hypothetical protein
MDISISGDQSSVPHHTYDPDPRVVRSLDYIGYQHRWNSNEVARLVFVNSFWATFEKNETKQRISEPLRKLTLSFDNEYNRLQVIISY